MAVDALQKGAFDFLEKPVNGIAFVKRVQAALDHIRRGQEPVAALTTLTRLYYANGWYGPAAQTCAGLAELEPHNPRWSYLLALLRSNTGQLNEALPLLFQTIKLDPDYLPARLKTAAAMAKLNQMEAAIAMEKSVLEKEPANIYALAGLGNIYLAQKKWDLAREVFQKTVSLSDHFRPAWLVWWRSMKRRQTKRPPPRPARMSMKCPALQIPPIRGSMPCWRNATMFIFCG